MQRLTYTKEWRDNLVTELKDIMRELGKETFTRYRQMGKAILKSGYRKGQWHSEDKQYIINNLGISQQTFSRMVILAEMSEKEFTHTVSNFLSIHAWTNPKKDKKAKGKKGKGLAEGSIKCPTCKNQIPVTSVLKQKITKRSLSLQDVNPLDVEKLKANLIKQIPFNDDLFYPLLEQWEKLHQDKKIVIIDKASEELENGS